MHLDVNMVMVDQQMHNSWHVQMLLLTALVACLSKQAKTSSRWSLSGDAQMPLLHRRHARLRAHRVLCAQDKMAAEGLTELPLADAAGDTVAVAVLRDAAHRQPVFVSAGHRVALPTAVDLVRRCCLYKVGVHGRGSELSVLSASACITYTQSLSALRIALRIAEHHLCFVIQAAAWQVRTSCGRVASAQS